MKPASFYLSTEYLEWLKQEAENTGRSVNELVDRALAEYRARHG